MIIFDNPKVVAIGAIRKHVGVPVTSIVPTNRPKEFIRVLHTGGYRSELALEHHNLTLEAWAETEPRAWELIQVARGALLESEAHHAYSIGNAYPNPTEDGVPRYAVTLGIVMRGHEA